MLQILGLYALTFQKGSWPSCSMWCQGNQSARVNVKSNSMERNWQTLTLRRNRLVELRTSNRKCYTDTSELFPSVNAIRGSDYYFMNNTPKSAYIMNFYRAQSLRFFVHIQNCQLTWKLEMRYCWQYPIPFLELLYAVANDWMRYGLKEDLGLIIYQNTVLEKILVKFKA